MADPHDPGSPLAGVEMPVAPPTRPVDDDGPLPSTNRPDPAPPDSQASPDDGGPDAPDAPARPPRRPRRWWLLAAVPAVLVLVAVALGDQRRWPVLADAAVADGTALRIVPHAYGAEADAVQRVERVGPDGTDAIAMSFAIGPQQLEQVAGSPAGWIAAVVFAWDDGRPNGRSLWRQAPDGTTSELGPVDAGDALVGVTDDGAVTIRTGTDARGLRTWDPDGEPTRDLEGRYLYDGDEDSVDIAAAAVDPATGELAAVLLPEVEGGGARRSPQVVRLTADGEVVQRTGADEEAHRVIESVDQRNDEGSPSARLVMDDERVLAVGPDGSRPVLPRIGALDRGRSESLDTDFQAPSMALTEDGDLVKAQTAGRDDTADRGPEADADAAPSRRDGRYLVGPAPNGVKADLVQTRLGDVGVPKPVSGAAPWLLSLAAAGAAIGARRTGSEELRRGSVVVATVVGLVATVHVALQALWGWPQGSLVAVLVAGATAAALVAAVASPPEPGARPRQGLPSNERTPPRSRWSPGLGQRLVPAAALVVVVVVALAAGDQRRAPFVGTDVDTTGRPYLFDTGPPVTDPTEAGDGDELSVVSVLDRTLWRRTTSTSAPVSIEQGTERVAGDGTVAVRGRPAAPADDETEADGPDGSDDALILVLDPAGQTREIPVGAFALLLGVAEDGTVTVADADVEGDVNSSEQTGPTRIVRLDADGERTVVAEVDDLELREVDGASLTDPRTEESVLLSRAGPTTAVALRVTSVDGDGEVVELGPIEIGQLPDDVAPAVGPDRLGLLSGGGYLPLRPEPGPLQPLELDDPLASLFTFGSAPDASTTGGTLDADGTLRLPSPWAAVDTNGDVTHQTLSDCDDNRTVAASCRVEVAGRAVPPPWTVTGHVLAAVAALGLAALAATRRRRSAARGVMLLGLSVVVVSWLWAVVRVPFWDGVIPPENDRFADGPTGPPSGQPVLTLALAYVATVGVAVALLELTAPLAARVRARRRSRWERFAS